MADDANRQAGLAPGRLLLKQELQKGLDSGVSKRTPSQIRAAIRKAREAA